LRALLGVNARCEIFEYLLVNGVGSPRAIASDCYYYPATISKTMAEMSNSGFLISRTKGRRRLYSLTPETWGDLFLDTGVKPGWVVWPRLFSALEQIWLFLDDKELGGKSALEQASSLRRVLIGGVVSQLESSLPGFIFGNLAAHLGEKLVPFFVTRLAATIESIR
jgi:predicted transcriptional regulator